MLRATPEHRQHRPAVFLRHQRCGQIRHRPDRYPVSAAYAYIRMISETIASPPPGVYEATAEGNERAGNRLLYRLLHDEPHSEMTSFISRKVMLAHLLLCGQIIRGGHNTTVALYPLLPDRIIDVDRNSKGSLLYQIEKADGNAAK